MPKPTISSKKIKNIKKNDTEEAVKILGIYFTKDLQTTINYDWNRYLTNIEKQTQHLFQKTSLFNRKSHIS